MPDLLGRMPERHDIPFNDVNLLLFEISSFVTNKFIGCPSLIH